MKSRAKKFSPAVFGMIIISFFLPFAEVSCSGQRIMSVTGLQMVTGTTIQQPGMFGEETESQKIAPQPLAIVTLSCVVIGLILSFIRNRRSAILPAVSAAIGTVTLVLLKSKIDNDVFTEGGGAIQVRYVLGFWVMLILLIVAVGLNVYVFSGKNEAT